MSDIACPKCGYRRKWDDRVTPEGQCPKCGIIYAKYGEGAAKAANREEQPARMVSPRIWIMVAIVVVLAIFVFTPLPEMALGLR